MNRHEFLKTLAAGAASIALPRGFFGQQPPNIQTYTYKTVGGCEIKANVLFADPKVRKPVLVWIHGGGLLDLSRKQVIGLDPGDYVEISIDYRLAPETKLPGIIQDVQDAFRWIHKEGPKLFNIDVNRLVVGGMSAGGYLTLMSGFCVKPRPRALFSLSGYGDITTPWYSQPSPYHLQQPLVSKEEAYASIGTTCLSEPPENDQRPKFGLYCRQKGIWPKEVTGHDPATEPKWFDPYCPVRNVTAEYPPTLLMHQVGDPEVPYQESVNMDKALAKFNVVHKLVTVPGEGHVLTGLTRDERVGYQAEAMAFLREHSS